MDAEHLADLDQRTSTLLTELHRLRIRLDECEAYYSQLRQMIKAATERQAQQDTPRQWTNQRTQQPEPWRHSYGDHMGRL
jgi:hypothetical protein